MDSNISVESESCTIFKPICENSRSTSISSMSSIDSIPNNRENNLKEKYITEDLVESEMIRKKAMQQMLWQKTRTYSIDSQEVTPRNTISLQNVSIRERDMSEQPVRRNTPTIVSIQKMVDMSDLDDRHKFKYK